MDDVVVYINSRLEAETIQKLLFSAGCKWQSGRTKVDYLDTFAKAKHGMHIHSDKIITFDLITYYKKQEMSIITYAVFMQRYSKQLRKTIQTELYQ